MQIRDLKQD